MKTFDRVLERPLQNSGEAPKYCFESAEGDEIYAKLAIMQYDTSDR